MAIFRRKPRSPRHEGMPRVRAGLITIVVLAIGTYFGFTKANPFASPFEMKAAFETANNLSPRSPVRIAGVDIGKVTKIEAVKGSGGAAIVTMEIKDKGLPIHEDAQLKIRPRIFLEGNFFIDMRPGSPSAPELEDDGKVIPITQTAAPVQFGDLLAALQSDTREDLQTFLEEYSKGLAGAGARGFNRSIRYWKTAYRSAAIANDATLGEEPTKDIQRVLRGQGKVAAALASNPETLKDLVTNLNRTAAAFAREDVALEASIPALRDTLREAQPALASLNGALPSLRAFARDALPGARSSGPTLDAALPFIRQLRRLVSKPELRGTAAEFRVQLPRLVKLNRVTVPVLEEGRTLSSCTNRVLVPFVTTDFPDPDFPENTGTVNQKFARGFVGLSGESRTSDANQSFFHTSASGGGTNVRPAPPPEPVDQPPPRRPDVPCETQEPPNLSAPGGPIAAFAEDPSKAPKPVRWSAAERRRRLVKARRILEDYQERKLPALRRQLIAESRKEGGR
jgi:phospholipid/cholesterol/gamma-HCH transport system substrate-binding protein